MTAPVSGTPQSNSLYGNNDVVSSSAIDTNNSVSIFGTDEVIDTWDNDNVNEKTAEDYKNAEILKKSNYTPISKDEETTAIQNSGVDMSQYGDETVYTDADGNEHVTYVKYNDDGSKTITRVVKSEPTWLQKHLPGGDSNSYYYLASTTIQPGSTEGKTEIRDLKQ